MHIIKKIKPLTLCLALYSILAISLVHYYRYQINPDGISYISIAHKYLNINFAEAINAHWGPFYSWLLMPFLALGVEPLFATKVLSLLIGMTTIIAVSGLSHKFEMEKSIRTTILFSLIPIVLYFAFVVISPDLLTTCILLFYFTVIFGSDYAKSLSKGVLCGAIGGLAYLSKSYAFPFFLCHYVLFNLFQYLRNRNRQERIFILRNCFAGFCVFCLISGSWIVILGSKYGELTIGTAGRYNSAVFLAPKPTRHLMYEVGLTKPPNDTAVSIWEDPSYYPTHPWSPLQSLDSFKGEIKVILENTRKVYFILQEYSSLSAAIIIACVLVYFIPLNRVVLQKPAFYFFITLLLYCAGYVPIYVESRYLWVACILIMLMGGHLLNILFQSPFFTKARRAMTLAFFVLCFVEAPIYDLTKMRNKDVEIHNAGEVLKAQGKIYGNIASNYSSDDQPWRNSLYLSYYLNAKYFGQVKQTISEIELQRDLRENGIDYFFVWDGSCESFLSNHVELGDTGVKGLRIYSLKDGKP